MSTDETDFILWGIDERRSSGKLVRGYGKTIEQRLLEGQGELLPGGKGREVSVSVGWVSVHKFLNGSPQWVKNFCYVWYRRIDLTVDEKAQRLGLTRRGSYVRRDRVVKMYQGWLTSGSQKV